MGIKSLSNSSGIVNFQKHQSMLAGIELNKFHHLETVRLGSSAASVEFTNLGQYSDFQHLQVRFTSRITETVGGAGTFYVNVNGDTGSNYARHNLRGDGSSVASYALTSSSTPDVGYTAGAESAANIFSAGVIDILDPFETTKYTTMRSSSGLVSGYKEVWLGSVLWMNTAPLTSISFETYGVWSFVSNTRFSIYGLKARA